MTRESLPRWQIFWRYSLFESADSGWSLIVVSTYFGTLIQVVFGRSGASFGWATTIASLAVALISPLLGAVADQSGRRQPYLRWCVAGVVLFTGAIGFVSFGDAALVFYGLAYVCVNAGFMLFLSMLPAVSGARNVSSIVGMTVGIGYVGALACLGSLGPLAPTDAQVGRVFLPMALIYLALALPVLLASPDFASRAGSEHRIRDAYRQLANVLREAKQHRAIFRFLIGDFLYENAVASTITLMGLYARNILGFSAGELKAVFGPAIVVAALSAWFIFGPLIRVLGPKRVVLIDLCIWLILFAATLIVRPGTQYDFVWFTLSAKSLFTYLVAPLAGLGLAGVWSSSRVMLTALTPVEMSGKFWGLYNLSGRTATVLGDATWSVILSVFGEGIGGYHVAVVALAVYVVIGAGFILTLPDTRPSRTNFLDNAA